MSKKHSFHIPVMGIGFTIDTPLKVSQYGMDSVISVVDDILLEKLRKMYCEKFEMPYNAISEKIEDFRAKRITSYLNLINQLADKKMKQLKEWIHSFDFVRMKPARDVIREPLPKGARCQVLAEPGRQYAAYFKGAPGFAFTFELPPGNYHVRWHDVVSGHEQAPEALEHPGGSAHFRTPSDFTECALKVTRGTK